MKEIRMYLRREISALYPEGETSSITQLILEHCGFPSPDYLLDPQRLPGTETVAQINEIVNEIHTHRPIQYILGYTRFFELKLFVNENILIPRPETEEMIYKIIEKTKVPPSAILDLGTGSGCIALSLKKQYPAARVSALEFSTAALDMASANGDANALNVRWIRGDMLDPSIVEKKGTFDLIVSNPPYVLNSEKALMDLNVLEYEPSEALFVENSDPLVYYRAIAVIAVSALSEKGELWVEINERLGTETALVLERAGLTDITIHKDIHEKERYIRAGR